MGKMDREDGRLNEQEVSNEEEKGSSEERQSEEEERRQRLETEIQLVNVLESYIQPTITRTWEEEVPLEDIEFPLVIKICIVPGFNQTA